MNKLLLSTLLAVSMLAACGDKAAPAAAAKAADAKPAAKTADKAQDAPKADEAKPQILAPKPPPPPGGGQSAPELKPEDIARIQAMLKQREAEQQKTAPAAKK